ncbi:hypothetical protein GCM10022248_82800 [Nonomuraea soli]
MIISMKSELATKWLASACREAGPVLAGGVERVARVKSVFFRDAHRGVPALAAALPVYLPTQQIATKGGLRGPQPWRDRPVIT